MCRLSLRSPGSEYAVHSGVIASRETRRDGRPEEGRELFLEPGSEAGREGAGLPSCSIAIRIVPLPAFALRE